MVTVKVTWMAVVVVGIKINAMKKLFIYTLGLVALTTSCSHNDLPEQILSVDEVHTICATIKDFDYEPSSFSRTSITIEEDGPHYAWAETDTIGIFPNEGRQVEFSMADGAGTTSAKFTGGGWGLKSSSTYSAYFPLIGKYYLDKTKIPVDYTGQIQNGNNSTVHLSTYDYLAAPASEVNNGTVSFNFERLGCLVQLKINLLEEVTISNISVKCGDDALFTNKGYINLTSETLQIETTTSEDKSKVINIKANNLQVASNETAIIYFMMAPVNLEGNNIEVVVTEDNGFTRTFQVAGKNFIAGKAYSYSMALSRESTAIINVSSAGKFSTQVTNNYVDGQFITDLKITGKLNGTDIKYLRERFNNLVTLDMSEVDIVTGGDSYYTNKDGNAQNTSDNIFPAYFMTESKLTNLESIILPNSVTTIPYGSFVDIFTDDNMKPQSIYKLTKVVLGKNLTTIGELVFACSMKSIHIPANVTSIGGAAFGYCPYLETITVDSKNSTYKSYDGVLYWKEKEKWIDGQGYVPAYTVSCCPPAKTSIEFPNDMFIYGVLYRGFSDCVHLTKIELPEGIEYIGSAAFARCISLEKVSIPSTIELSAYSTKSSDRAFYDNPAMKELHLNTTTPPAWYYCTGTTSKSYLPTTCKLYVPYVSGWWNSSTNRSNWAKYFSIYYDY